MTRLALDGAGRAAAGARAAGGPEVSGKGVLSSAAGRLNDARRRPAERACRDSLRQPGREPPVPRGDLQGPDQEPGEPTSLIEGGRARGRPGRAGLRAAAVAHEATATPSPPATCASPPSSSSRDGETRTCGTTCSRRRCAAARRWSSRAASTSARYLEQIAKHDMVFGDRPRRHRQDLPGGGPGRVVPASTSRSPGSILARPAVEAGEKLGFLPGDLQEKVDPYLRPALRRALRHASSTRRSSA